VLVVTARIRSILRCRSPDTGAPARVVHVRPGVRRQGAHSQPYMYSIRFTHSTFQFVLFEWRAPAPRPSHSQHILNWTDSALSAGIDFDAYPSQTGSLRPIVAPVRPGLSRLQFFPPLAPWGPAPGRVLDATARCLSVKHVYVSSCSHYEKNGCSSVLVEL
jgi:hypothetical protein